MTMEVSGGQIKLAFQYYQSGNLQGAEDACRKILKKQPDNVKALHLLGMICSQRGDYVAATKFLEEALRCDPNSFEGFYNLGRIYLKRGDTGEAIRCFQKVIQLNPYFVDAYLNLGNALRDGGRVDEAIACYKKIVELNPHNAGAYFNLGVAFQDKEEFDEAIACYLKALELNLSFFGLHNNLGLALQNKGLLVEALASYKRAIELNPNFAEAHYNMGNVLRDKGELNEAIACYQKALRLNAKYTEAYVNLGIVFKDQGRLDEALACYRKAIQLNPDFADAHLNLSLTLLLTGNFEEGWDEYEWRWRTKENTSRRYNFPLPLWDGSPLKGKTIFVYAEQGVGDEIMFACCLPEVIAQADLCIVACEKRLVPLFSRSFPSCVVTEHFDPDDIYPSNLPLAYVKIAIGSLPKFLRPDRNSFLKQKPYLIPDKRKSELWRGRFASLGEGLKVGIAWRGGRNPYEKLTRSIELKQWTGLFSLQGVHYVNLQYGDCENELKEVKETFGVTIHDWEDADPLKDLDGFASQVSALDLVISIDNATVHMAGALGVPVWSLLPSAPNWRWMLEFEDTPWYPTMRLFRQSTRTSWCDVFERVRERLKEVVELRTVSLGDRKGKE